MAPTKKKTLKFLFDADMIAYNACAKSEEEWTWPNGLHTIYSQEGECRSAIDSDVQRIVKHVLELLNWDGPYEIVMVFSDPQGNFRKEIFPMYKENRADKRKPLCYWDTVAWVKETYETRQAAYLEADDVIGIMATTPDPHTTTVIVSRDKDFKSIPGLFYNMNTREITEISREDADRFHLYQTLIGDTSDNYPGCPGVGPVKADKVLAEGATWENVLKAYGKAGLAPDDALLQARVARILRYGEYIKQGDSWEVQPWNP